MDSARRSSLMDHFFKMLRLSNAPTATQAGEDEIADADEPPDDRVPELTHSFLKENLYTKSSPSPQLPRRESLLTRAILTGSEAPSPPARTAYPLRGLSTASSHSFASTAELTSDDNSPIRSASPSPPPPANRIPLITPKPTEQPAKVIIAPVTKDDKPDVAVVGEAAIEKTLGRKRCIMFACNNAASDTISEPSPKTTPVIKVEETPKPAPRKCRLTFACPTRQDSESDTSLFSREKPEKPAPAPRSAAQDSKPQLVAAKVKVDETKLLLPPATSKPGVDVKTPGSGLTTPLSPSHPFHEFASSHDETDDWVEQADELHLPKLTLDDCLRKENAIRKIGKEAEEEAEAEERELDELENELDDDNDGEDDFAPSDAEDNDLSDGGNESDDEEGFADSDDESEAGSEYQFWTHSSNAGKSNVDNITHFSVRQASRSRVSSVSSTHSESEMAKNARPIVNGNYRRPSKLVSRMRPGTPELPDSTDFVCGTLDEDRPLEAAYISCREEKRRQKHIPIPQDIDPSFPTTDPEDEDDDLDEVAESSDHVWFKGQFQEFDDETRGRRKQSAFKVSPLHSPSPMIAPPRQQQPQRSTASKHGINRSPAPPKQGRAKSPAPTRRLFDHPPKRLRSPPPTGKLRSPRGSPTGKLPPLGITITRLAQRPKTDQTSSLPHTPNPFFRNWRNGSPAISRIPSAAVSPGNDEVRPDLHVRGPVDIVIGLEKKRQKRKEKFWRQHCRKAAKEQAERRPPRGRGAERMKELGLECAERTRGYGLGQQAQLVLSL